MQQDTDYHLSVVPGLGQLRAPVSVSVQEVLDSLMAADAAPPSGEEDASTSTLE
ncbi:MAG: hypothetical protein ACOH2M_00750 [Cypionkella sp.]